MAAAEGSAAAVKAAVGSGEEEMAAAEGSAAAATGAG